MASSPITSWKIDGEITSWEIDGETVETVSNFIFLGSKITADSGYSHEIKRHLLLGRKVTTNLVSIFKSRTNRQSRFDAGCRMLGAGALG